MIVNPPRSEVDFSSRLQSIAVQAADKNQDPDDLPPLIPTPVKRRVVGLVLILVVASGFRVGLGIMTQYPEWINYHTEKVDTFRKLAHDLEANAMLCRSIVKSGKPETIPSVGIVTDPVLATSLAAKFDKQAASYRKQAHLEESLNQGYSIR